MRKMIALSAMALLIPAAAASAQLTFTTPSNEQARAPRPARANGPSLELAVEAAQLAVKTCAAKGLKVTSVVVDSAALPVVVLSGDGAAAITQSIGMGKAVSSVNIGMDSGDIAEKAKTDTALAEKLAANPQMGPQRPGGIVIKNGSGVIGAIAVSGAPSGAIDAECARAGLAAIAGRLG